MGNVLFYFVNMPVYSYGFTVGLGLLIGSCLALREGKRKGIDTDVLFDWIVYTVIVFAIAGRIAFVFSLHGWRMFTYPWVLFTGFQINESAGFWVALVYAVFYMYRNMSYPVIFLDVITPSLAFVQSMANLGSNVFGRQGTVAWTMTFGQFTLHPVQLYAAVLYYVIFAFIWRSRRTTKFDGQLILGYISLNFAIQWFLERFRDTGGTSTNPYFFLVLACGSALLWLYIYWHAPLRARQRRGTKIGSFIGWLFSTLGVLITMTAFFFWRYG